LLLLLLLSLLLVLVVLVLLLVVVVSLGHFLMLRAKSAVTPAAQQIT
jgi:hypothetical protein